ncbi:restriction endonuclease [Pseudoxanthomonas sp.]|uniref:restriction endonuclease n=1 Tax=Pseudoxanthomonas sp. TaxID=1871049 RepID=UPI002639AA73|nr:restriction endonuclease [Pseudoxanthomonas sp.]WDS36605.1 MAG: restriction endonuclease [Pseudoxanthomonas sp.]
MPSWLIGTLVALALGLAATFYLWVLRRRIDETSAGLLALAAMRWRDFSRLVLSSLQLRGLERLSFEPEDVRNQHPSFLLGDAQGKHWLLSCKHGTAYRIGSVAIDELASEARLRGAHRAILATEGVVDATGRDKAERSSVEVLDGARLWHEVKPMLDSAITQRIVGQANLHARRRIGLCWILALLTGVLVTTLLPVTEAVPSVQQASTVAPTVAPVAPPPAATTPTIPMPAEPVTEQELAQQRSQVAKALAKAGGLRQPMWISGSTLSVDMLASEAAVMATVCAELAKHPELTLSRIQLNPAPDSNERVRWRQCEAAPLAVPPTGHH